LLLLLLLTANWFTLGGSVLHYNTIQYNTSIVQYSIINTIQYEDSRVQYNTKTHITQNNTHHIEKNHTKLIHITQNNTHQTK